MKAQEIEQLNALLETDRSWCAYALADLYPPHVDHTQWYRGERALVLIYDGLEPPVLFAYGDPQGVGRLVAGVPADRYQYALLASHRGRLGNQLVPEYELRMWRMVLDTKQFEGGPPHESPIPLGEADLAEVLELLADHPDRPDAFARGQLKDGHTFGIRRAGKLAAISGTHVVSPEASVAAIGNVFTHPDHRNLGLGRLTTGAVVRSLLHKRFRTIVLNVSMTNDPALACYRHLGFLPYCGYYEGVGKLSQNLRNKEPSS